MYSKEQVLKGIQNPILLLQETNKIFHHRLWQRRYYQKGVDVMSEDWDNLLILDSCRYDLFKQRINGNEFDLPGRLNYRISRGSDTVEWLRGNIAGKELYDTVYVTANPQFHIHTDAEFHSVINVWQHDEGWNEAVNTVLPEVMESFVREAAKRYPQKRILAHFIQPHYPFLGPTGRANFDLDGLRIWQNILIGDIDISDEILNQAYSENLDVVLPSIARLLEDLPGKTVVSSDHGQVIGERVYPISIKEYGHPRYVHIENLLKVPWLIHKNNDSKTVVSSNSGGDSSGTTSDQVSEQLQALGYK